MCLIWSGGQEREGSLTITEYLMNFPSRNILKYGPVGKRFEPIPEASSFWWTWSDRTMKWECREDGKTLKENCEKMSESEDIWWKQDSWPRATRSGCQMLSCSSTQVRLGSTPPGPILPTSTSPYTWLPQREEFDMTGELYSCERNWRAVGFSLSEQDKNSTLHSSGTDTCSTGLAHREAEGSRSSVFQRRGTVPLKESLQDKACTLPNSLSSGTPRGIKMSP